MERKFEFSIDEFYHVYNRGNNKSTIFLDDFDRRRFQRLLYVCNSNKPVIFKTIQGLPLDRIERDKTLVDIGAYCLMPNHFHILLREKIDGGISSFAGKLLTAYSMYFNKKYERTGTLFEGPFQATYVDDDQYLKYLFSYIHLNPVKIIDPDWRENGILNKDYAKKYLEQYGYSSYTDYIGKNREEGDILNKNSFPGYFVNFNEFENFIDEWLSLGKFDFDENITT